MALDELSGNQDHVIEESHFKIVYDRQINTYLEMGFTMTVDYRTSQFGGGFTISGGSTC